MSKQNIENSTLLVSIGENVRLLRKRRGFSQEKLAEMADLHTTTISEIECGKSNLTIISLERIAHALSSSLTALFPQPLETDDKLFNDQIKRILANHHEMNDKERPIHGNVVKAIADAFENINEDKKSLS